MNAVTDDEAVALYEGQFHRTQDNAEKCHAPNFKIIRALFSRQKAPNRVFLACAVAHWETE